MRRLVYVVLLAWSGVQASAMDLGDAVFPVDMQDKSRMEFQYGHWERDITFTPGGGEVKSSIAADHVGVRLHSDLGDYATLDFDLGVLALNGGDYGFLGGLGGRFLIMEMDEWRLMGTIQGHYAPSADGDVELSHHADGSYKGDLLTIDGGLGLTRRLYPTEDLVLMPYFGPVFSLARMDGEVGTDIGEVDATGEEENLLGVAFGVSVILPGANSIRAEARYFDQFSTTLAMCIAY